MKRYEIVIGLDEKGLARSARIAGLLEDAEVYELMKTVDGGRPREDESVHFAHHDFAIEWSEQTQRQEVLHGVHRFFGGMGEGNSYDSWKDALLASLYDLYQTHDDLEDGDVFVATYLGETVEFRCEGIHVVLA
jgi:hypothetical protein